MPCDTCGKPVSADPGPEDCRCPRCPRCLAATWDRFDGDLCGACEAANVPDEPLLESGRLPWS